MSKKPVVLMVLDGYGLSDKTEGNAVALAKTPVMDKLMATAPFVQGAASGLPVGLPDGQMGNSEVGHMNIGAGRIIYQELTRITKAIADGDFFENEEMLAAIENCKKNNSDLHLWGLLSDGGVHSHNTHMYAIVELAKKKGVKNVYVHAFLDGRDVPPTSGKDFVEECANKLKEIGLGKIATVMGRYYAMDRDNRWDRVEKAYNALLLGEGEHASSAEEAIQQSYAKGNNDEFVLPTAIGGEDSRIHDNDSVIFWNFRPDRAREITKAVNFEEFDGFARKAVRKNIFYVCMTEYDETFTYPVAFGKERMKNILGDVLEAHGIKQFRTAETEKYAHVTFFFNGGVEEPQPNETRVLVASPKVATYDLQPEMSAKEVCENVLKAVENPEYGFILVNFANPDMVGHTGVLEAAIKADKTVDECVGRIAEACKSNNVIMLLTADHGNSEVMVNYETKKPMTAHTTNEVPFVLINAPKNIELKETGALCNVAPTILDLMGIEKPAEMDCESLIK